MMREYSAAGLADPADHVLCRGVMEFWTEPNCMCRLIRQNAQPALHCYRGRDAAEAVWRAAAALTADRLHYWRAVNPRYDEIMGVKSYPECDGICRRPRRGGHRIYDQVRVDVLQEITARGGMATDPGGFAERDADDRRPCKLRICPRPGMRISGPNSRQCQMQWTSGPPFLTRCGWSERADRQR